MKKQLVAVFLCALATTGCSKVMNFVGVEKSKTTAPAAAPAMTLSEPVREVQPKAVAGGSWESNVARDIPYFNMSALPVAVYSDVEFTQKTGTLAPGEGGYVETCSDAKPVCKIAYAGNTTGWVKMDRMGGVSN